MFHVKHFCKIFQKNSYKSETNFPRAGVRWREKIAAQVKAVPLSRSSNHYDWSLRFAGEGSVAGESDLIALIYDAIIAFSRREEAVKRGGARRAGQGARASRVAPILFLPLIFCRRMVV